MRFELDLPKWQWPFYVSRHPFEGYEDLRWKKGYDMRVALVIVLLFFIITVFNTLALGFVHGGGAIKIFNVMPYLSSSVILFFMWVVGNWALCTLFDGEGSMKNICCVSAYALVPYLISLVVITVASNFLLQSESAFLLFAQYIGLVWSVVLMISGIRVVHQYSVPKTLIVIIISILAMAIILFIMILLVTMLQQLFVFGYSIFTELQYRISM